MGAQIRMGGCSSTTSSVLIRKVHSAGLQTPGAAASSPTSTSSVCLITDCVLPPLHAALLGAAQAFVSAAAFELGHEAWC
jgi:hypothetical protein